MQRQSARRLRAPPCASCPVKCVEQQSMMCAAPAARRLKEDRTACINRIRGLLAEFGLGLRAAPREVLRAVLSEVARRRDQRARARLARLTLAACAACTGSSSTCHLAWCDERIARHVRSDERAKAAAKLLRHRPVTASATGGHGRRLQAVQERPPSSVPGSGLVPQATLERRQRRCWAEITKRGDAYLRTLLIQGAKSAVSPRTDAAIACHDGSSAARSRRLAEGRGGAGQQARAILWVDIGTRARASIRNTYLTKHRMPSLAARGQVEVSR